MDYPLPESKAKNMNYDDNALAIKAHQQFLRDRRVGKTNRRTRSTKEILEGDYSSNVSSLNRNAEKQLRMLEQDAF